MRPYVTGDEEVNSGSGGSNQADKDGIRRIEGWEKTQLGRNVRLRVRAIHPRPTENLPAPPLRVRVRADARRRHGGVKARRRLFACRASAVGVTRIWRGLGLGVGVGAEGIESGQTRGPGRRGSHSDSSLDLHMPSPCVFFISFPSSSPRVLAILGAHLLPLPYHVMLMHRPSSCPVPHTDTTAHPSRYLMLRHGLLPRTRNYPLMARARGLSVGMWTRL